MDEEGHEIVAFLNMVGVVGVAELDPESLDRLVSMAVGGDGDPDLLVKYGCDIITRLRGEAAARPEVDAPTVPTGTPEEDTPSGVYAPEGLCRFGVDEEEDDVPSVCPRPATHAIEGPHDQVGGRYCEAHARETREGIPYNHRWHVTELPGVLEAIQLHQAAAMVPGLVRELAEVKTELARLKRLELAAKDYRDTMRELEDTPRGSEGRAQKGGEALAAFLNLSLALAEREPSPGQDGPK